MNASNSETTRFYSVCNKCIFINLFLRIGIPFLPTEITSKIAIHSTLSQSCPSCTIHKGLLHSPCLLLTVDFPNSSRSTNLQLSLHSFSNHISKHKSNHLCKIKLVILWLRKKTVKMFLLLKREKNKKMTNKSKNIPKNQLSRSSLRTAKLLGWNIKRPCVAIFKLLEPAP